MKAALVSMLLPRLICVLVCGATGLLDPGRALGATPHPTTTTLSADPTTGAPGTVVTLTATVTTGGTPVTAGSVQFTDGSRVLASVQVTISGPSAGKAILKTPSFGIGPHSVTASYSGAPNSAQSTAPSKSSPVAITITGGPVPTSTNLLILPSTDQQGTYDITATVLAPSSTVGHGTLSVNEYTRFFMTTLGSAPITTTGGFLQPQFLNPNAVLTGAAAVGDLNGDGIPDLVFAVNYPQNDLLVEFGDPNHPGQFLPPATYSLSRSTPSILIGDVNGDGLLDVVTDGVGVLLNDPAHPGQLQPEQLLADSVEFFGTPVLADLNGDGVLDLAGSTPSDVIVFFGDPAHPGEFLAPQNLNLGTGGFYSPLVADFNQDGLNDIAVVVDNQDGTGNQTTVISIFVADPLHPGKFTAAGTYPTPLISEIESLGDFNGDGLPDILAGGILLLNESAHPGTFSSLPSNQFPGNGYPFVVADLDGDGTSDLIALQDSRFNIGYDPHFIPGSATVLLSDPASPGQFVPSGTYTLDSYAGQGGFFATAVDINGDGQLDLVALSAGTTGGVTGRGTVVALGAQVGTFSLRNAVVGRAGASSLRADYSGDEHYQPSMSPLTDVGTSALPTTNQLTASSTSVNFGTAVTFTASIQSILPVPAGSVVFYDGSAVLCTSALDATGQATCAPSLGVGGHTVVAAYAGQGIYLSSTSSTLNVVVGVASPKGTLTATPNPIVMAGTLTGATTTLEWSAPTASTVEIHVGSPTGTLFAGGGTSGSATTGAWVTDGMVFCLQDTSGGKPLTSDNTLAVLVVHVALVPTISASPNPIPVQPGSLVGTTTIHWNSPNSTLVQVWVQAPGTPQPVLFASGGSTGSATTGDWVTDGTLFYLVDANTGYIPGTSIFVHLEQQRAVFTANPNPILTATIGTTTLEWNAPTATIVEIHVGSPTGTLFAEGGSSGSAMTGNWVTDGMVFYLQDVSGGKQLTPANTLAQLVAHVGMKAYFSASPNPISTSIGGYGSTTLLWNAPSTSGVEIHLASPSGPRAASGGATGSFVTLPVSEGTVFYLQDASNGNVESSSNTLAMVVVHVQEPSGPFLIADPNPATTNPSGYGTSTLQWNAPAGSTVQIRVGTPDGALFAQGGSTGFATTGDWVTNGEIFYLQDITGGKPLTSANTLAILIMQVSNR